MAQLRCKDHGTCVQVCTGATQRHGPSARSCPRRTLPNAEARDVVRSAQSDVNVQRDCIENRLRRTCTRGCTLSQWVLNATHRDPSATTPVDFNPPVHHDGKDVRSPDLFL